MNVLMVLTSHDRLGDTGERTGFWLEEFAAPYYTLKDGGAQVTLASSKGGQPPVDPVATSPTPKRMQRAAFTLMLRLKHSSPRRPGSPTSTRRFTMPSSIRADTDRSGIWLRTDLRSP